MDKLTKEELKKQRREQEALRMAEEAKKNRTQTIAIWIGVILILILGVYAIVKTSNIGSSMNSSQTQNQAVDVPAVTSTDNITGKKNAKVTLIEYADFQCPACGHYHPLVKQLIQELGNQVQFVYRYFPLTQLHPNAMLAAQAAYAAGQQGKFWDMNNMLYEHQDDWAEKANGDAEKIFQSYAQSLSLDMDKFNKDMTSKAATTTINSQRDAGINIGVNATPTFYLDNKQLDNPTSYDDFKKLLTDELAKQK